MSDLSLLIPDFKNLSSKKQIRALGIDLGTTNSTITETVFDPASSQPPSIRCLEVEQYTTDGNYIHTLVPSAVALYKGKEIIGEGAKQLRARATEAGLEQNKNLFYDCKNDIGIKRTYHKAPEGYRSAAEIGGKVLRFLHDAARSDNAETIVRTVVTVPASFQAAQRADTLKAATLAGLKLSGGDLLDEPVAAFIDYLATHQDGITVAPNESKNLIVFDFGGGTCDVAIFKLTKPADSDRLTISPLAVSRYHRLGGGDIDSAILYQVLIPQIEEQNGLAGFELGFSDKKKSIEPSFIGLAEALKIGLCNEITRLEKFGTYFREDKEKVVITQPGKYTVKLDNGKVLSLTSPKITAAQFETLLKPFLDRELLYARETEYRMTCSVFAPLQDAIDRSRVDRREMNYCLLVGGSCLIPQVVAAVRKYLPACDVLTYNDAESIQTAVSRGAAWHALSLALTGKGLITSVCHDTIAINTQSGPVDLIPKGAQYPYPSDGSYTRADGLAVPQTSLLKPFDLTVEIVAKEDERSIIRATWQILPPVQKGDKLALEYRYDENQVLDLRLRLADVAGSPVFTLATENPLTNVVNPQALKLKIDTVEEELRTNRIPKEKQAEAIVELAGNYAELRQHEKAVEYLGRVLRAKNKADPLILNRMGLYCGELGDNVRQEKFYREAAENDPAWNMPWFNLAYVQCSQKKYDQAMDSINRAISKGKQSPHFVLKARICDGLGDEKGHHAAIREAIELAGPIESQNDWCLGWFIAAAQMSGNNEMAEAARSELQKRQTGPRPVGDESSLPILSGKAGSD
ncbi:MAG: Hsp70 family protein [Nitrospirota bacterium]